MFGNAKAWHNGLSKGGKTFLWSVTAVLFGTAINANANQSQSPAPNTQPLTAQIAPAEQEKEKLPVVTTKDVTETQEIPFSKVNKDDPGLTKGKTAVSQKGINGVKTLTYTITYSDSKETDKKLVKEEVTTQPVPEITNTGTYVYVAPPKPKSNCDPNYSPCIPNVSYDLNCPDIGHRVTVIGTDRHRLDADNDGTGCDSY